MSRWYARFARILAGLFECLQSKIASLYILSESIALLDMIHSFVSFSITNKTGKRAITHATLAHCTIHSETWIHQCAGCQKRASSDHWRIEKRWCHAQSDLLQRRSQFSNHIRPESCRHTYEHWWDLCVLTRTALTRSTFRAANQPTCNRLLFSRFWQVWSC